MMRLALKTKWSKLVPESIIYELFDDTFVNGVNNEIEKLNPACSFIDYAQAKNCSAAEAVHKWLQMSLVDRHFRDWLKRDKMICNIPSILSYSLHPGLKGELLSEYQRNLVKTAIYNGGRGESAYSQFENFLNLTGNFGDTNALQLKPLSYWKLMSYDCPELSEIALTYIPLPASSASLERVFSMWTYVHNKTRNRLSSETSELLIFVYHSIHSSSTEVFSKFYKP